MRISAKCFANGNKSVAPTLSGWTRFGATRHGSVGRQTGIPNLIKQGAVADIERLRRLFAVPVMRLEHFQDDLSFQFANRLARELLELDRAVEVDFSVQQAFIPGNQVTGDNILCPQNDIALDEVFKLPNISRPVVLLQNGHELI